MSPNLTMSLGLQPVEFWWNGRPVRLSGAFDILPDNQVRYLHKRVLATKLHDKKRIPFYGRVVGQVQMGRAYIWLVECEETGKLWRTRKPEVLS